MGAGLAEPVQQVPLFFTHYELTTGIEFFESYQVVARFEGATYTDVYRYSGLQYIRGLQRLQLLSVTSHSIDFSEQRVPDILPRGPIVRVLIILLPILLDLLKDLRPSRSVALVIVGVLYM